MSPRKLLTLVGMLCVLCWTGRGVAAGPRSPVDIPVLKMVPGDALGVVVVKNMSQIDEKLAKLGQVAQLPLPPSILAMVKAKLGASEGIDEKGTAVFAVIPGEHEPAPLVILPVTDYDKFIGALQPEPAGDNMSKVQLGPGRSLVVKKGNYAIITEGGGSDTLKAVLNAKADISAELSAASAWIADQDVAAVATATGIKMAVGPARQGLQNAKKSFPADNPQYANVAHVFEMYENLLKACEDEVTQAALGVKLDKEANVHLTSHWGVKSGGSFAKALAGVKNLSQKPLADLPAGPYVFATTGVFPQHMMDWYLPLLKSSPQFSGIMDEQLSKLQATMTDLLKGVDTLSMEWGAPQEKQPVFSSVIAAMHVENAPKYIDMLAVKMPEIKQLYQAAKIPGADSYEMKPLDVNGAKGLQFTMNLNAMVPPSLPPGSAEKVKQIFSAVAGPDGKMTVTYVAADDKTVLEFFGSGDEAKKKLAAYKNRSSSLSGDVQTAKTLAMLPADAQWVGVWDLPGTVGAVKQLMAAVAPDAPTPMLSMIPALPAMPPLGFAATVSGQSVDTDLVVPVETVKGVAGKVQEAMMPRATAPPPQGALQKSR